MVLIVVLIKYNIKYINFSFITMFETTSEISEKENKSQTTILNNQTISLPNIPKKPASRGEPTSRKDFSHKQKLTLPQLSQNQIDRQSFNKTQRDKQNVEVKNKASFAKEVQQKLNLVLGEMQHQQNFTVDDSDDSDDLNFQQKINQNRQIIKMHKLKNENSKVANSQRFKNANQSKNKKQLKSRNQSLYEKRIKQYRDQSIENKYLQKKKQTVKQQNQNFLSEYFQHNESLKQIKIKLNDSLSKGLQNITNKKSKQKYHANKILSQQPSQKNLIQNNKNQTLFDSIQNYLQNPHQNRKQSQKQLVGLSLLKAKRDLQDKIKLIDQKLGCAGTQNKDTTQNNCLMKMNESARDWRRVQIGIHKFNYQQSNFDKQLQRISALQQKNSQCLEKYLAHQKLLVQLQLRKNQLVRQAENLL